MAEKWLVIDDSATIQRVIKLAFQDYDVHIIEADSIQDGLRELSRSPSTLVIADAALAGVQSVQDFERLRQSAPASAFVILEGSYDHIDEIQFRSAGFRFFLKKPFDAAQLIAITREALGRTAPQRFEGGGEILTPPPPLSGIGGPGPVPSASFGLNDEGPKAPPPLPGLAPHKSLSEELEHPFGDEGFDLGLDVAGEPRSEPEPSFRPGPQALSFESLDEDDQSEANRGYVKESSIHPKTREHSYNPHALSGMLEPMLRDEMDKIVRQSVEEYCRKHFAELAREFLLREIEKLSSERARLLVDK